MLISYAGTYHLSEVLQRLSAHLTYQHTIAVRYTDGKGGQVLRLARWQNWLFGWKPILVYSNGPWRPPTLTPNILDGANPNKDWHPWQQPIAEALWLVEKFSRPGDLVVDPMAGSGTFGLAAKLLGRRFLGTDVDPIAVDGAQWRLKNSDE